MSCGIGRRCSSDPMLLWLWCRRAATAPIRPLAWEPPYATAAALKRQKGKKKNVLNGWISDLKIYITILNILFYLKTHIWSTICQYFDAGPKPFLWPRCPHCGDFFSFLLFFFSLFPPHPQHMEVARPGLNPSRSCNLHHSRSNAGSLTHCAGPGIQLAPPQR